jgi:prolyl-tRNA synthetase
VLLRGDQEANEGKIRRALGAVKLELADPETIAKVTGAPVGFAGPVGVKCRIISDHDVPAVAPAITGANEADAHLVNVYLGRDWQLERDDSGALATHDLRNAGQDDPCPRCSGKLTLRHAIEVGHVFKLGTKYSTALAARFLDDKEQQHDVIMGCYGIGVNRIIAALIETKHDANGILWSMALAPYQVLVVPLNVQTEEVMQTAVRLHDELETAGIDVLLDDRDQRAGVKFKDGDLIGIPLRVVVGDRGLKEGKLEIKWRHEEKPTMIALEGAAEEIARLVRDALK